MSNANFDNFEQASRTVLAFLHSHFGFALWMVTRTDGDDWIVLQAEDHGYGVREGDVYRWADSFCVRMVDSLGPRLAPYSARVPAYAAAPIGRQLSIGAYIGVPLERGDGSLFGTRCAIDPCEQPQLTEADLQLVELLAGMLATILIADLRSIEEQRLATHWRRESLSDALTGLANRRAWDLRLAEEEVRARRYGTAFAVLIIDLDDLKKVNDSEGHAEGDRLIRASADCLQAAVREMDFAARIGGDEFAVLAIDCGPEQAAALVARIAGSFAAARIEASIGSACRDHQLGMEAAWAAADEAMYRIKSQRRNKSRGR